MIISKKPIPKGMSQGFKSSVLDQALRESGIGIHTLLTHAHQSSFFVEAWFHPSSVHQKQERLEVVVRAVADRVTGEVQAYAHNILIPDLTRWVRGILAQDRESSQRRATHYFSRDMPDSTTRKEMAQRMGQSGESNP